MSIDDDAAIVECPQLDFEISCDLSTSLAPSIHPHAAAKVGRKPNSQHIPPATLGSARPHGRREAALDAKIGMNNCCATGQARDTNLRC